jgi:MscS family membrane protein
MEELTHDFLSFLPAALLALAAAGAPEVYKLAARRFLDRAKSHMASWLYILLDSFLTPVAGLFRVLLGAAAVKSLPFELVRDAVFLQYLNLAADLLVIFYISLGCWRAAPVTRLLLRSAQNHLDLETNQTMGHFFENIFHALVGLFAGIAMLDRLGVPVSGLLTGAGVAGLAVSLAAQSTLNNLIAGITLVLERPFGIGDYIVLGDCEGTVEDISFPCI